MRALSLVCLLLSLTQPAGCVTVSHQRLYVIEGAGADYSVELSEDDPIAWVPIEGAGASIVARTNQLSHSMLFYGPLLPVFPMFERSRHLGGVTTIVQIAISHPEARVDVDWSRAEVVSEHGTGEMRQDRVTAVTDGTSTFLGANFFETPPYHGWLSDVATFVIDNRGGVPARIIIRIPETGSPPILQGTDIALKLTSELDLAVGSGEFY